MKPSKNYDKFGLIPSDHDEMRRIFENVWGIKKVTLFGSRAKGNWKRWSDVDVAVTFAGQNKYALSTLHDALEETTKIPYFFDVIDDSEIHSPELQDHIKRAWVTLWSK